MVRTRRQRVFALGWQHGYMARVLTRREQLGMLALAVVAAGGWWGRQPEPPGLSVDPRPPVGAIYEVARNLYVVPDGGGNTAVFITRTGVVLVDTKFDVNFTGLMAQVRTVTNLPVTHVINTHFHGDHTGGNDLLPFGVQVIVHENAERRLREVALLPRPNEALRQPVRTYRDRLSLFDGEDAIELYGISPSHTDGDTMVIFRAARVAHVGDVFVDRVPPTINLEWGGDGVGYPAALAKAAAEVSGVDRVITGHGGVLPWQDFVDYADFTKTMLDYVQREMRFGRDKATVFRAFRAPARFGDYNMARVFDSLDEMDRSNRPRWQRIW